MFYLLIALIFSTSIFAQNYSLSGYVFSSNGKTLSGANVIIAELKIGTTTDENGFYSFENLKGEITVKASYIGYENFLKTILINKNTRFDFSLKPKEIFLGESIITAETGKTPYAFSNIENESINRKIGSQDVVYGLQSIPNIFVSPQGGGTGDLRLNIRGFSQTNIGIMIDGVPVNNPENGEVYWSNWAGMSDILSSVQVQRGLGFVPYSVVSVGGNVNFITMGNSSEEFVRLKSEFGSDNFRKFMLSFSKMITEKISLTSLITKKNWDGYADKTQLDEITYFFSINGSFGSHRLKINLFGSPQNHGQRLTMQSINFWKTHDSRFNSDWGYLNSKPLNLRNNVFHKPTISLNHQWQVDKNIIQTNIIYFSYGEGGGIVPPWVAFSHTSSGLIDFDSEFRFNSTNIDSNYHSSLHYTRNALRFTIHKHYWSGLISSIQYKLDDFFFTGGIDFKYYSAENYRKIENLLGGDYTIGSSNINRNPNELLFVGDKVDYNADSFTMQNGVFVNTEYSFGIFTNYLNLSLSNTAYKRIDYFNYKNNDPKRETSWKNIFSYVVKSGFNLDFGLSNIYFNIGYFTKPPLSENVFDYNNHLYHNIVNEKILNTELGYNLISSSTEIRINLFRTNWKDKAFSQTIQDISTGQFFFTNISGAEALHQGIEIEAKQYLAKNLFINTSTAIGKNKWVKNINSVIAPESNPTQQVKVQSFVKDTFVGGFPMTMAMVELNYQFNTIANSSFYINPVLNFYGNHYSQFNPNYRNQNSNPVNSWKLPDYFLVDFHCGFKLFLTDSFIKEFEINLNVFNILNRKDYIVDAFDGINHDSSSAIVWIGRDRWWHISSRINL